MQTRKEPTGVAHSPLLLQPMPHRCVATRIAFVIIRTPRSMMKIRSILLAAVVFCLAAPVLTAESDDPSETFLKAYMTAQQGEKLEHENQFKAALAKYRFAGSLIEQLRKAHSDWQPAIVEYRGRKVSESILRVQDKASTQESVNAPAPPIENAAAVPPEPAPTQVAKEPVTPLPAAKPAPAITPNEVAIEQATRKLRDRVDQLEAELQKSRTQMSAAENEKQSLNSRLDETRSKLDKAQGDLDKAKTAEKQVRDQLTQAQASLKKTAAAGSNEGKAQAPINSEPPPAKSVMKRMPTRPRRTKKSRV
ncbi:MAG: hypothetical protein DME41_02170 [Verrucomicrobia bacterium]|nr:MAG: hypothetical protein DME41_02170 [Verrucomicrobiota bacterium]